MKRLFARIGLGLCVIGIMQAAVPASSQNPALEYEVKGTFLYNFAQFIQWPPQAFPNRNAQFTICMSGDPFGGALEKITARERLNGRRIGVRRLGDTVAGCQIVFVGHAEAARSAEIIKAAANMPILTVGESEDFINIGGMIRFTDVAHRVRFEINPDAAERASLRVSSRLLRVGDIVHPRRRAAFP